MSEDLQNRMGLDIVVWGGGGGCEDLLYTKYKRRFTPLVYVLPYVRRTVTLLSVASVCEVGLFRCDEFTMDFNSTHGSRTVQPDQII